MGGRNGSAIAIRGSGKANRTDCPPLGDGAERSPEGASRL